MSRAKFSTVGLDGTKESPGEQLTNDNHEIGVASVMPNSLEAERSVLGTILLNESALTPVLQRLVPEDFFLSQNVRIFGHMMELHQKHVPIDVVTLLDSLERDGDLEAAGGAAYVSQLPAGLPRLSHVEHYAAIVRDDSRRRLTIHRTQAIMQAAFDRDDLAEINKRLTETAELIQSAAQEHVPTVNAKELCTMKLEPRTYLIDGLIKDRSMSEIFSWRGLGKTWLALSLGHAVGSGGKFLKWQAPKPSRVLFVDGELDADSLQQRLRLLGAADNENLELLSCDMLEDPFPHLATARAQRIIEDKLADARFLILDNLSALAPSSNEREAEEWILIQTWMGALKRQGISTLFLHHAGHAGHARGTTRREDLLDLVVELRRPKDYVASEGLRFEIHFTKTRAKMGASADPIEVRLTTDLDNKLIWNFHDLEDARLAQVVELRASGTAWRKIEEITGVPRSTAERIFNAQK